MKTLLASPRSLFGEQFHLVRSPNRYSVPAFYELHTWVWQHNPYGMFEDWNPRVRCDSVGRRQTGTQAALRCTIRAGSSSPRGGDPVSLTFAKGGRWAPASEAMVVQFASPDAPQLHHPVRLPRRFAVHRERLFPPREPVAKPRPAIAHANRPSVVDVVAEEVAAVAVEAADDRAAASRRPGC